MALSPESVVGEEIRELKELETLLDAEREGLVRMDREALMRSAREKERVALRLERLREVRRSGEIPSEAFPARGPDGSDLLRVRNQMARAILERCRAQGEMLHAQAEQVGQLVAFLQNLRCQASVYDRNGRLRRT